MTPTTKCPRCDGEGFFWIGTDPKEHTDAYSAASRVKFNCKLCKGKGTVDEGQSELGARQ